MPKVKIDDYNWLIYGPPKVGKTSFANEFESPLLLWTDSGQEPKHIECTDIPVRCYQDIIEIGTALRATEHNFKTIVIDTVDSLVDMLYTQIENEYQNEPGTNKRLPINAVYGGYGEGYRRAASRLVMILSLFNQLGLSVVLLSHEEFKEIQEGQIKYHKRTIPLSKTVREQIIKWVDVIAYCHFNKDRKTGERNFITFKGNEYLDAGMRTPPGVIPIETCALDYSVVCELFQKPLVK